MNTNPRVVNSINHIASTVENSGIMLSHPIKKDNVILYNHQGYLSFTGNFKRTFDGNDVIIHTSTIHYIV
jgi:hypothetical protein